MCNQTVSLVAAEMERRGIVTVVVQLLRNVAEAVGPPRALCVPFRFGYPLGAPDDPALQQSVLEAALSLVEEPGAKPPMLRDLVLGRSLPGSAATVRPVRPRAPGAG